MLVKLCLLIASTSNTPQIVNTGEARFTTSRQTEVYRCEWIKRSELHDYLRSKDIKRYVMKQRSNRLWVKR